MRLAPLPARSRPAGRMSPVRRRATASALVTAVVAATALGVVAPAQAVTVDPAVSYSLVAVHSGKAIDVPSWSTASGTALIQYTRTGQANQLWQLRVAGAGYYTIANRHSAQCLTVSGGSTTDGAAIVQQTCGTGTTQQFRLVPVTGSATGAVKLQSRSSGKLVDVSRRTTADEAPLIQWRDNGGTNQHWTLVPAGAAPRPTPTSTPAPTSTPTPTPKPTPTPTPTAAGPYTWRNAEIVGGGFVSGIVYNPKQRGLVYARTDMGGAYRRDASTGRWIPLTDWAGPADWNLLGVQSLATDPVDPRRVYLATGTYTNGWSGNGSILRSADQGATWQRTDLPFLLGANEPGRSQGERLVVDPNNNRNLWLATPKNGLWRSTDQGVTWAQVASFPVRDGASTGYGLSLVTIDPRGGTSAGSRTIYVGANDASANLYRSTDGGATWSAVPGAPTGGLLPHHAVLASDGTLYVTYGNGVGPNGMTGGAVHKLSTATGTWTDITPLAGGFGYAGLAVDAARPGTVMVATMDRWWPRDEIYRSTDGGAGWTAIGEKATFDGSATSFNGNSIGHWIGDLEIDPFSPGSVLYVTGAGIWGSDDVTAADSGGATSWTIRAQGLEETAVLALVAPPGGASVISGLGDIGGFRHDDLTRVGVHFRNPTTTTTTGLDFAERAPSIVVRTGNGGKQHGAYSTDGGTTWTPFPTEPGVAGGIAASADGTTFVWKTSNGAASYTRDRGASWTAVTGLPSGAVVLSDRVDAHVFYALSAGTLYRSTDRGATFTQRATGLASGKIEAVYGHAGHLWLASSSGLFRSTDGGASFVRLTSVAGASVVGFGRAAPGRTHPAAFMVGRVGSVTGVYRSDDTGATWVRVNDDLHQFGALGGAISGDPDVYGRVYVGTNGRGVQYGQPS